MHNDVLQALIAFEVGALIESDHALVHDVVSVVAPRLCCHLVCPISSFAGSTA